MSVLEGGVSFGFKYSENHCDVRHRLFARFDSFRRLIGKLMYGKDVRDYGSGNMGTTNTFRVLGKRQESSFW